MTPYEGTPGALGTPDSVVLGYAFALWGARLAYAYPDARACVGMHSPHWGARFRRTMCVSCRYGADSCKLELVQLPRPGPALDHKSAFGRLAFATRGGPAPIWERAKVAGGRIINDPITLRTPGKADVVVTILSDPDAYEICFVNEAGFDDLCATKPGDDFVDWGARWAAGGDGRPPPRLDYRGLATGEVVAVGDEDDFAAKLEAARGRLVVVDFMGTWCKVRSRPSPSPRRHRPHPSRRHGPDL